MFEQLIDEFLLMHREGLCIIDDKSKEILYADKLTEKYFGDNLVGIPCYQVLFGKSCICENCPKLSQVQNSPNYWEMVQSGEPAKMYLVSGAILKSEGRHLRICRFQDISEYLLLVGDVVDYAGILYEQASAKGYVDELTGLSNRNRFIERKNNEYMHCKGWGVLYFDINNMKAANDELGHEAGDALIRMAASAISTLEQYGAHIYRIGGDEFLAVLPDCDESFMQELLHKWESVYHQLGLTQNGIPCRIAVGIAFGDFSEGLDNVIRRADERMYIDKRRQKLHSTQTPF
ncbi:MAG: GGDEF domain-containing protein [Oscillospiraceae bacterium]